MPHANVYQLTIIGRRLALSHWYRGDRMQRLEMTIARTAHPDDFGCSPQRIAGSGGEPAQDGSDDAHLVVIARSLLALARRRSHYLPGLAFFDPQWLMVLDLFVAAAQGRELPVSSLCIASGAPPATAWRNIRFLERRGLILRKPHPSDGRSYYLQLSQAARGQIAACLRAFDAGSLRGGSNSLHA